MRVLVITSLYPTSERPLLGCVVERQVAALQSLGVEMDVCHLLEGGKGRIGALLKNERYDLLHVHYGLKATVRALRHGIPIVGTYHGTDINGYSFTTVNTIRKVLLYNTSAWSLRNLLRFLSAVIVMTKEMRIKLPPSVQRKTSVIPMGIDLDLFHPHEIALARKELGWDDRPVVLICDNNEEEIKRLDLARAIIDRVREDIPTVNLFVLRGYPRKMIPLMLSAANCLLIVSDKEGSPNIVKEAMACNLPIVSVPVGDLPHWAEIAGYGVFVEERNVTALSSRITGIINAGERTRLHEFMHQYSDQIIAEQVLDVYKSVISS